MERARKVYLARERLMRVIKVESVVPKRLRRGVRRVWYVLLRREEDESGARAVREAYSSCGE